MATTKDILKTYFETGDKPTEAQFAALIDAFRHVDDKIEMGDLSGLAIYMADYVTKTAWSKKNTELETAINEAEVKGVATPESSPTSSNKAICYFASETGTYVNFTGSDNEAIVLNNELALLKKDGDLWVKLTVLDLSKFATLESVRELLESEYHLTPATDGISVDGKIYAPDGFFKNEAPAAKKE